MFFYAFPSLHTNPAVKEDKTETNFNDHKTEPKDGQDYADDDDDSGWSDAENSEEDSHFDSKYDDSRSDESGSSEFKRKLNDPEYTAVFRT